MRQGLLYDEDMKSVTKVVKACIVKLNKEWEKVSELKQKEAQLQKEVQQQWDAQQRDNQDSEATNNHAQDAQKRNNSIASSHESGSNYQRLDGFSSTSQSRVTGTSQGDQQGNNHQSQNGSEYNHGDSQVCCVFGFYYWKFFSALFGNFSRNLSHIFDYVHWII